MCLQLSVGPEHMCLPRSAWSSQLPFHPRGAIFSSGYTLENQHYPVVELALYVFIILSLGAQETNVLDLLTRVPGVGITCGLESWS